jgi:purine-cytosine permease-like protein
MGWIITIIIVLIISFWFIKRIYSRTKDQKPKNGTQGIGSGENGVGGSDAGADDGE